MFLFKYLICFIAPLGGMMILMVGASFLNTLLVLEMGRLGGSKMEIGLLTTAFYAGYVLGAYKLERFIKRVGHIRAYCAFASIIAIITILHGILNGSQYWYIMRLIYGFCNAGIFIVVESWLLNLADVDIRGRLLAIYMLVFYLSQATGQYIFKYIEVGAVMPYTIASILASLSILPLCATKAQSPQISKVETVAIMDVIKKSWSGVAGCLVSGLLLGSIYGIFPILLKDMDFSTTSIGKFMAIVVLGGALLQYPIGKLSDIINRRTVLFLLVIGVLVTAVILHMSLGTLGYGDIAVLFIFGGALFAIYPLATNLVCDYVDADDILAAIGTLLIIYSVGATAGPLIVSAMMQAFGNVGFYIYIYICSGFFILIITLGSMRRAPMKVENQGDFISAPATTPITAELNPRSDED